MGERGSGVSGGAFGSAGGAGLKDEEDLLMYWVLKYLEEGVEMEKVVTWLGSCGSGSFSFFCFS